MRAHVPSYQCVAPLTLKAALSKLADEPGVWRPLAGGTDVMVLFEAGKLTHRRFLSLWALDELRGIEVTAKHITLGALTTYSELQANPVLAKEFPILAKAARETGALAIQNRGTIGGNLANASPAADSSPGLLVYEAELELVSRQGKRWVPYTQFHSAYKVTALAPDELIRAIRLPRVFGAEGAAFHCFRKVGTRKAQAISKIVMAGLRVPARGPKIDELRIAFGSVGPIPLRATATEAVLRGKDASQALPIALQALTSELAPLDDVRSTAAYRRQVALNLLSELVSGGAGY